ncbi:MAG TPA: hypothetical protein VFN33_09545 [Gaiellaceae bacterium]|nr:hypothetical protein [Gaiellaceae bacterium]
MTAHGAALELAGRRTVLRRAVAPGLAVLACLLVAVHAPAAVRAPVVILCLLLVPGAALVGLLNVDSFALELSLAIALSVAVSGLTAVLLVYTHLWSPTAVVLIVAAVSLAGGLRDVGVAALAGQGATWCVGRLRTSVAAARPRAAASLVAASVAIGALAHRAVLGLRVVIVAAARSARRAVVGLSAVVVAGAGLARQAGVGLRAAIVALTSLGRRAVVGSFAVSVAVAAFARRAGAGLLTRLVAVVPALARRAEPARRIRAASGALGEPLGAAGRRRPNAAAARRTRVARHARPQQGAAPAAPEQSLQAFLLDELRRHSRSDGSRRRRPARSLAELEPHELADLLSWSSLQRFVSYRAVQQINPELWFVDDLERRLARRTSASGRALAGSAASRVPRGVWITGVSERTSVPVAWRVLKENGRRKEWRTRLALEAIDSLYGMDDGGGSGPVVTAGTSFGSLSGFRSGLEERGLPYLLRVDAVTAARELAPDEPAHSAAEARDVVRRRLGGPAATTLDSNSGGEEKSKLVLARRVERLVIVEVASTGDASVFWLSNIPAGADRDRLTSLVRLARHHNAERSSVHDLLRGAPGAQPVRGADELQQRLAVVALAQGLRTIGISAGPKEGAVEA